MCDPASSRRDRLGCDLWSISSAGCSPSVPNGARPPGRERAPRAVPIRSPSRSVDFERGSRNFRIFTVIRLASALDVAFAELLAGVAKWHIRPLAPPAFLPGEAPTKAERDQLLVRLWREGCPEQGIAEALDLSRSSVGPYVRNLRDAGENLSYRRAAHTAVEAAARRRRGHKPVHKSGPDQVLSLERKPRGAGVKAGTQRGSGARSPRPRPLANLRSARRAQPTPRQLTA